MNKQIDDVQEKINRIANDLKTHCCDLAEMFYGEGSCCNMCIEEYLLYAGYRKQEDVAFEVVEKFRDELINIFIDMCGGNDYTEINLLQIGNAIDALYDSYIAELKKKYGVQEDEQAD